MIAAPEPGARFLSSLDDTASFAPILFDPASPDDAKTLAELRGAGAGLVTRDRLADQVRELIKCRAPGARPKRAELERAVEAYLAERGHDGWGCWVFYPWRRELVRVLPEPEFVELRTERNRYRITEAEQGRLADRTVGIVGLSAGHSIALCLALERVGTRFKLADFDAFELANMNRVACGLSALGVNKAVLAARQISEIDPYLHVSVFAEGITPENIDAFMEGEAKLDVLIEECDDLYMKVRLREEARARSIPVVMETNDRGLIDIERFDLEPERPVFHGLLEGARSEELRGLDTERKVPFLLRILGEDMSSRLAASLIEIDKTISGWPQLASGNALGGALAADTTRRVLLGQFTESGRYRVDLEQLISGRGIRLEPSHRAAPEVPAAPGASRARIPPVRESGERPSREEVEWLVEQAVRAPSGGNDQPWKFRWRRGSELDCFLDRERSGKFLDYECLASYLALGAAAENLVLAASSLRRRAELSLLPESSRPELAFRVELSAQAPSIAEDPLAASIETRATNRRLAPRRPLDPEHVRLLEQAASERGCELSLIQEPSLLDGAAAVLGAIDRFRFLCEPLHTAMMGELRFTHRAARDSGDGIDVATLELDAVGMAGLRLLSNERTASFLRGLGHGAGLEKPALKSVAAASALALLSIDGDGPRAYLAAGRGLERVWLKAEELGLAFQPMSVALYLFLRLRGGGSGFSATERDQLAKLEQRFALYFPLRPGRTQALLFRLAHAPSPTARALRRPVANVLVTD